MNLKLLNPFSRYLYGLVSLSLSEHIFFDFSNNLIICLKFLKNVIGELQIFL